MAGNSSAAADAAVAAGLAHRLGEIYPIYTILLVDVFFTIGPQNGDIGVILPRFCSEFRPASCLFSLKHNKSSTTYFSGGIIREQICPRRRGLGPGPFGPGSNLGLGPIWAWAHFGPGAQNIVEIIKSYEFTDILRIQRNPTNSQESYGFTEILQIHRNNMNSQKSYEFTEILRIHKNPTDSHKSYKFTESLRIHRNPTNSQKSKKSQGVLLGK